MTRHPVNAGPISYRQAIGMARYWYQRYERLPRWRHRARNEALALSELWGVIAKYALLDEKQPRC